MLVEIDEGADRLDLGATISIAIATESATALRRSRILGGRDWVRLGAVEMGLDCLRRYLKGLPVDEKHRFREGVSGDRSRSVPLSSARPPARA